MIANWGSQTIQLINKLGGVALLFFGARLVIDGKLTVGELVAFNMLAGQVAGPVLRLAQLAQDFQQAQLSVAASGRHSQQPDRAGVVAVTRQPAGHCWPCRDRSGDVPLQGPTGPKCCAT
jgi:hypothetical protein